MNMTHGMLFRVHSASIRIQLLVGYLLLTGLFVLPVPRLNGQLTEKSPIPEYVENVLIFKVKENHGGLCSVRNIADASLTQTLKGLGVLSIEKIYPNHQPPATRTNRYGNPLVDLTTIYEAKLQGYFNPELASAKLRQHPLIKWAEPRYVYQSFNPPPPQYTPNEPSIATAGFWWINAVQAREAWFIHKGDPNITIGIVDTGFDLDHPDLIGKLRTYDPVNGIDDDGDGFIDNLGIDLVGANASNPVPDADPGIKPGGSDHGAMVAGCAAAATDNGIGTTSPGFNCTYFPVKASGDGVASPYGNSLVRANEGIVYAADRNVKVLNCSFGILKPSAYSQEVTDYATFNKDVLVVAAAGNANADNPAFPAANEHVLGIAGIRSDSRKSNVSSFFHYVDLAAPATMTCACFNDTYTSFSSGFTSHASPMAASMAALIRSYFPSLTALQAGERLRVTADNINLVPGNSGFIDKLGRGRPNMYRSLTEITPAVRVGRYTLKFEDGNNNRPETGESVSFKADFRNYLSPTTSALTVTLSTASSFITVTNPTATLGTINTLGTKNIDSTPLTFTVNASAPANGIVFFKLTYSDGTYQDFEYFYIYLNQMFADIRVNKLATSYTSNGNIGYINFPDNWQGWGIVYDRKGQVNFESGLMIGTSASAVADPIRNTSTRDADFVSTQIPRPYTGPGIQADFRGESKFTTTTLAQPLEITHRVYADSLNPNRDFVLFDYYIKNTGTSTLSGIRAGLFNDFDVDFSFKNRTRYDAARRMQYTYNSDSNRFVGVVLLSHATVGGAYAYVDDGSLPFTSATKFQFLSSSVTNAEGGLTGTGAEMIQILSAPAFDLAAGATERVTFALVGGLTLAELHEAQEKAVLKFLSGEPLLEWSASTPSQSVAEGNSGTTTHTYTVNLSGATNFPVSVDVNLSGDAVYLPPSNTTFTRDYYTSPAAVSNTITLTFNSNGSQNISVIVYGNTLAEADNTINLTLANPTNDAVISLTNNTRTHTILNDDGQATLNFTNDPAPLIVNEGNSGFSDVNMRAILTNCGDFPFNLTMNLNASVQYGTTTYTTLPGAAGGSVSYQFVTNNTQTLQIRYYGNTIGEPDKTITVSLTGLPSFVNPTSTSRTLTILNDDGTPVQCSNSINATPATNVTANGARANWNVPPGVVEYEVRYGFDIVLPSLWSIVTVSAPASFVDLTGLFPTSQYRYQVRFKCASNDLFTGWSNTIAFSTSGSPLACVPTANTQEDNITATTAAVSWAPVANAAYYRVEIKPSSSSTWVHTNVFGTSHVFEDLMPNTSYDWRVRTRCGSPVSSYSVVRTFTTLSGSRTASTESEWFKVYPNPVTDYLTVTYDSADEFASDADVQLVIQDALGRVVWQDQLTIDSHLNWWTINTEPFPAGVYYLQLRRGQQVLTSTFIRTHH
jgi:subtilisin family serine protease